MVAETTHIAPSFKLKPLKRRIKKVMTPAELDAYRNTAQRAGVIYLSSIPTRMPLTRLRQEFERYGEVGRIYLAPASKQLEGLPANHPQRAFMKFKEGWVEFLDKRVARQVAAQLNTKKVGGKNKHAFADELWNIKYLPKFKWTDFTELYAGQKKAAEIKTKDRMEDALGENRFFQTNKETHDQFLVRSKKRARAAAKDEVRAEGPSTAYDADEADTDHVRLGQSLRSKGCNL